MNIDELDENDLIIDDFQILQHEISENDNSTTKKQGQSIAAAFLYAKRKEGITYED